MQKHFVVLCLSALMWFGSSLALAQTPATMLTPNPGTTLTSGNVTFTWTPGTSVTEYWLWIGSAPGTSNLYDANQGLNTSSTVPVPTLGVPVYVRLFSYINNAWQFNDYTYTEYGGTPAILTSPTNGTVLPGASATFFWAGAINATEYWIWIGTAPGTSNIYDANQGLNTSATINGLPTNGATLYLRLFSYINAAWQYHDYTYTAYSTSFNAQLTSPTPGSTFPGSSATFNWSAGTGATEYELYVGTMPGTYNLYDSGQLTTTTATVNNLPTTGAPIYVRLFSYIGGVWHYNDYTFTAYYTIAAMTSPTPGSTLSGNSATFNWSSGTGATEYWLWVGSAPGTANLYDANQNLNTSVQVNNLPVGGASIYVRLFSLINGAWKYNDYVYGQFVQPAAITSPANGSALASTTPTFTWNAGIGPTQYWLWAGSAPGSYNYYDASQGTNLSGVVTGLPQDGSTVYIRLLSLINGAWQSRDYSYKASLPAAPVVSVLPTNNPLVAQYQVIVPKDGQVWVNFGQSSYDQNTWRVQAPAGGGVVNLLVAGMQQNATYHLQGNIAYTDGSGWVDQDRTFSTVPLNAGLLPGITIARPNAMLTPSPGIELVDGIRPTSGQMQEFAVDLNGNVVWYYAQLPTGGLVNPIKLLPNGDFMMIIGGNTSNLLREIDLAGNTVHDFGVPDLQSALNAAGYSSYTVNSMHHDFLRLANGHTLVLVNRNKLVNGVTLLGDAIVDLDANYHVVWLWDTFDHLDTSRFPYGYTPTSDWTHCNALYYSSVDHSLLLSCRHQSWVVKIDYNDGAGTGNVLWKLGYQGDFTIASGNPVDWQYGQHNPTVISQSGSKITLSLFDDGNFRVDSNGNQCNTTTTNTIPCYSRNVIFDLDTSTMMANDSWSYAPPGIFSQATGSSQLLANGDLEAAFAFITNQPNTAQIIEVTHEASPRVVWQLSLSGETTYRSTRMGSLYPSVQW